MAEISYPFAVDSPSGGAQMISQGQWQTMAHNFSTDHVDWILTTNYASTDLPFAATVSGSTVSLTPGKAFVGGFYYQLTAAQSVTIAANTGSNSRIDLIVLRADLTSYGQVNLAVVQGQAAASPVVPSVARILGGKWELPLYQVNVPANSGSITVASVMTFDTPGSVAIPWGATEVGAMARIGSFVLDMDNNNNDRETEYFRSRDGWAATRHFGRSRTYTPRLVNVINSPDASDCKGTWRWVSPGVVYFTASIHNGWDVGSNLTGAHTITAVSLPWPAADGSDQTLSGIIHNPGQSGNRPNIMSVTGQINAGELTKVNLYSPSYTNVAQGLDALTGIPAGATLVISGTYLTNVFGD